YLAAFAANPNIVPFLVRGPGRRAAALWLHVRGFCRLTNASLPRGLPPRIGATVSFFVAGSALGAFALGFPGEPSLYDGRYPHLVDAYRLREHRARVDDGAFELGLEALIRGFEALYDTVVRGGDASGTVPVSSGAPGPEGG